MTKILLVVLFACLSLAPLAATSPRVLTEGKLPEDRAWPAATFGPRLFSVSASRFLEAWKKRAKRLRRQVEVANGIWPGPT